MTGIKDIYLRFERQEGWGPFHRDTVAHKVTLCSVDQTAVSAALLEFF
jgi:hypothetical protein